MMSSTAQGSCALTEQAMSASTSNQDVQFSETEVSVSLEEERSVTFRQ